VTDDKLKIIFFDGICNLCNSSVASVIRHDHKNIFKFASLQSEFTASFFSRHHYTISSDSIIYWDGQRFYDGSGAVVRIAAKLSFPVKFLAAFRIIPPFIRNWGYNIIARNRYRWFGKKDSCMVPTPELKSKFLD